MAVININFGSVGMMREKNTYRWKEANITAHNMGIKNELNRFRFQTH